MLDSAKTEPPTRRLETARWGLIPAWAKDTKIGARAFNARSEELESKPMFRKALEKRRAVVPASGYYEWKKVDGAKIPHYIHPADGSPLFMAGLYEWWKDPAKPEDDPDKWLLSFTILTRDSIGRLGSIHDRMPLFIDADHADAWLDPTTDNVARCAGCRDRRRPGTGRDARRSRRVQGRRQRAQQLPRADRARRRLTGRPPGRILEP